MLIMTEEFATAALERDPGLKKLLERFGEIVIVRGEDYAAALEVAIGMAVRHGTAAELFTPEAREKILSPTDPNGQTAAMTVSYHLPGELKKKTQYSVDASIYFEVVDPALVPQIKLEDFNPNNPNICFRDEPQALCDRSLYLDIIWALDAESPEAAENYVETNLGRAIPVPRGLKFQSVELGSGGEANVYDNQKQQWCFPGEE